MPPALRLLFLVGLALCAAAPARAETPPLVSAAMAPIADDDEPQAPASAATAPDAPMFDSTKADTSGADATGSINPKAAANDDDLMCAHAPAKTVAPVPAPFKFWLVVVCAPQAQALVPIEGMVWFAHGTKEPVSVLALPPGVASLPRTVDYNPSYNVRFKDIYASEAKGGKRARAMELLAAAQTGGSGANSKQMLNAKDVERVYQLDAVSSIYDMRYNIYFYVSDNLPRAGLICIDACRQMLLVDVLDNEEAQARRAKP
jgi:hypothetical protein